MKKLLILTVVFTLAACGCMNDYEEDTTPEVSYQNIQTQPQNCDYFDGTTCYRYVRRVRKAPVLRYRDYSPVAPRCGCNSCPQVEVAPTPACGCCAPQVKETREPVEVVYKKTTYKTVYEPKTTSTVSYERAPYGENQVVTPATPVANPAPAPVCSDCAVPVDSEEEILLDVK